MFEEDIVDKFDKTYVRSEKGLHKYCEIVNLRSGINFMWIQKHDCDISIFF